MNRLKSRAVRLGGLLALVLGAAALLALPAVAAAKDRNHDHIPDRWEKVHHLSLKVNQAQRDQDGDHLNNRAEFRAGDDPRNHDSDNDGVMDGEENAGTIASFDAATGKLTINLFGGETLSGTVDTSTEIKCEGADNSGSDSRRLSQGGSDDENSGPGSQSGDDNGGNGEEPGDDNGGNGEEPGDDNGGQEGEAATCDTASLVPGAVVQEAELRASNGVATFEKVELAHTN